MATHSSVLAWRIPGTGEPGGLSMGLHRVGHDWSDLAAAAAYQQEKCCEKLTSKIFLDYRLNWFLLIRTSNSCLCNLPSLFSQHLFLISIKLFFFFWVTVMMELYTFFIILIIVLYIFYFNFVFIGVYLLCSIVLVSAV